MYLDTKSLPPRPKGHPLATHELNELLALFGTLSIPEPRPKSVYLHPFARHVSLSPFRPYWSLVLDLAEEIRVRKYRKPRSGTHHYWVLRALLAQASSSPESAGPLLDEATSRYMRIYNTPEPEAHLPYLSTMLSLRRSTHLPQTARLLCRVLCRHPSPDRRFTNLLWEIVLGHVPLETQHEVLQMVSTRLGTFRPSFGDLDPPETRTTLSLLADALAMQISPNYRVSVPRAVFDWAVGLVREAFDPDVSVGSRWANLGIMALYKVSRTKPSMENGADAKPHPVWSTVLGLATLERLVDPASNEPGRTALRYLWLGWKTVPDVPATIRCIVMASFFRLAGRTRDRRLVDACHQYCVAHSLWELPLVVEYFHAALYTRNCSWDDLFKPVPPKQRSKVADAVLRSFLQRDKIDVAQNLFAFCQRKHLDVSASLAYKIGVALAHSYFPTDALALLRDERLSLGQLEDLFNRVVGTLRREAHPFRDIPLARQLFMVLKRLYLETDRVPHPRTKFSLRYALSILADSDHPVQAASLLRVLHKRQQTFFSNHYFLRMMRTLVKRSRLAAVSLLQPMEGFPAAARGNFGRKLALRLARTGAHRLAGYVYRSTPGRRTSRELLASAVQFRVNRRDGRPLRLSMWKIMTVMARRRNDIPTIRYGVALLARLGKISAAKRLLQRGQSKLDSTTLTTLGNAILNGALHSSKSRNARLVRHVLNTRAELEKRVGFVADRVTVNIVIKVLLRWTRYMTVPRIRKLFDHMVRMGYPAPSGGAPFKTTGPVPHAIAGLSVPVVISFERHVAPLYKMMIKALHLQGDRDGAGVVVGVLQWARAEMVDRKQQTRRK
uniref:Uncharacterized protein n=1 Tax=Mycena chlorophos TaxID=658473 RepID=A0ABQ0MBY6_MYCCL|nr:predicted protein [Mycena chlorophos]